MQTEFQRHQDGEFKVEQLLAVDAESVFDFLLGAEDEWASAFHDQGSVMTDREAAAMQQQQPR